MDEMEIEGMEKKAKVPKLRFPGFVGEWEERKIGDIYHITRGDVLAVSRISQMQTDERCYPVYSSQTKNEGLMGYYEEYLYENAITWTTDGANAGTVNYRDGKFYCTNVCGVLLSDNGYANKCAAEALNKIAWTWVSHVGNPKLMNNVMGKITIALPKSLEEQKKISGVFNNLDELFTLYQRKLTHLQDKKKCLLQKMFPKKGERFPELRFPGFTDDWEQRKVIDVAPLQRGFDLPTSKMELGKYPVVMSNGINGVHSEYKVKAPGVVTGRSGTIGRLHYIEEDFWPHNTTLWVTDFKRNNPLYVYYMYQNLDLSRFSVGSGVPTLNRNDVHNAVVYIPILKEQTCISQFFKSLDNLITLHERKLAHLQTQKKALLQQMFV